MSWTQVFIIQDSVTNKEEYEIELNRAWLILKHFEDKQGATVNFKKIEITEEDLQSILVISKEESFENECAVVALRRALSEGNCKAWHYIY